MTTAQPQMFLCLKVRHAQKVVEHVEVMALRKMGEAGGRLRDERRRRVVILNRRFNVGIVSVRYLGQQIYPTSGLSETNEHKMSAVPIAFLTT